MSRIVRSLGNSALGWPLSIKASRTSAADRFVYRRDDWSPGSAYVWGSTIARMSAANCGSLRSSPKESVLWSAISHLTNARRKSSFPDTPVARGTTMAKHKPGRRPKPEDAPQQPRDRLAEIRVEIQVVQQQIEAKRRGPCLIRTAKDLRAWERSIGELTDRLAALLLAEAMQAALDDPETRRVARPLAQGAGHTLKDHGPRDVTLRTTRGPVTLRAPYFSRNCDRDRRGKGMYPILLLWGVHDRCTAALVSEVGKLTAMLSSFEEVAQVLAERGHALDPKTVRAIAYRLAARARAAQPAERLDWGESGAGRRVVLSTDGGRIRIRRTKRGPKTAKGRNRYRTDWREPKVLIIY